MKIKSVYPVMFYLGTTCLASLLFTQAVAEESFKTPLVKQSLLLDLASDKSIYVVGERGHVLKANIDAQDIEAFTQVITPTKATLTSVHTINDNVWAVGHDATIIRSSDNGETWQLVQSDPELDRPFLDVIFFDNQEGVAVGAYGLFYRTMDAGQSWQQETHPSVLSDDDKEYLESIKDDEAFYLEELGFISPHFNKLFYHNNELFLAGEAGLLAKSLDKGRTWTRLEIDYTGSFFDVATIPSGDILAVGLRGNMFVFDGEQWKRVETCVTTTLNAIIDGALGVFALGNNGVILKLDINNITSDKLQAPNNEGCARSSAISLIDTESSDAILTASTLGDTLVLVTAGGLKTVVEK